MTIKLPDDELIADEDLAEQWNCTTRTLRRYESEDPETGRFLTGNTLMALDRDARQELIQAAERDRQADDWPLSVNPKMYAAAMREYHHRHSVPRHA